MRLEFTENRYARRVVHKDHFETDDREMPAPFGAYRGDPYQIETEEGEQVAIAVWVEPREAYMPRLLLWDSDDRLVPWVDPGQDYRRRNYRFTAQGKHYRLAVVISELELADLAGQAAPYRLTIERRRASGPLRPKLRIEPGELLRISPPEEGRLEVEGVVGPTSDALPAEFVVFKQDGTGYRVQWLELELALNQGAKLQARPLLYEDKRDNTSLAVFVVRDEQVLRGGSRRHGLATEFRAAEAGVYRLGVAVRVSSLDRRARSKHGPLRYVLSLEPL